MSVNDDMFVSASNSLANFAVIMHPFRSNNTGGSIHCHAGYDTDDRFVYSVAVIGVAKAQNTSDIFSFVFTAEKISTTTPYVCISEIMQSTCTAITQCTDVTSSGSHQEYFLIGLDVSNSFAFGVADAFVFKLDIEENKIVTNLTSTVVWPVSNFSPHAMDIAEKWAVVAGYGQPDALSRSYATLACYLNLSTLISSSCVPLVTEISFLIPSNLFYYNELYELSVAIRREKIVIGVHRLETIILLTRHHSSLNITDTHYLSCPNSISTGRVINWVDNRTIAVLILNPYDILWSKSQIYMIDVSSTDIEAPHFSFPNNQQIVGTRLSRPSFIRFGITIDGNMGILTDDGDILLVPLAPPGYSSTWIETNEQVYIFFYEPTLCIGGTYKNWSSLGPCYMCPPGTRNPGTLLTPVLQCLPCTTKASNSTCPSASLIEMDMNLVSSYSQMMVYPETSGSTQIDDILMKNVFQLASEGNCLVISPIFWTIVASTLCLSTLIFMSILKIWTRDRWKNYRLRMKMFFQHIDLITEQEKWIGGLASISMLVLVSFSYWFSASFHQRYPIEKISSPAKFSCDRTLINAQFSTTLELLSLPKSVDEQSIFDLLDQQTFNLTIELINTGFQCDAIVTQENFNDDRYALLSHQCSISTANAMTSVSVSLPRHQTTVQFNMTGPHWIGAIRLCVRGRDQTIKNSVLRQLDFCQFYSGENRSLDRTTLLPVIFIKSINMTRPLYLLDPINYSGLWLPTFSQISFSDDFDNYLRYSSSLTIIQVEFAERPFFIKNIQQPIGRTGGLVFHALLLTFLCLDLFVFIFLFSRLMLIPLIRWLISVKRRIQCSESRIFTLL